MFQNLEIFRVSHAMAEHAATRQSVISQNMANADTPGYVARDVTAFKKIFEASQSLGGSGSNAMRTTRAGHFGSTAKSIFSDPLAIKSTTLSPNGNSVSIEEEMMKAVDVKRQHDRALAIYKSSLGILRTSLGSR